jgi:ATP-dependent DNA helicase RecQ
VKTNVLGRSAPSSANHLQQALHDLLGYPAFRPGQEELIRAVLEGRDAMGILPTGGGKSVCFQLPAVLLPGLVLVISPLISLMEDQVGRARAAGLKAAVLNATTPPPDRRKVMSEARSGTLKLLFVSPERLHVADFAAALSEMSVSLVAVDEAHCISLWGHDFRPAYLRIGEIRRRVSAPILALTATATPRVREEMVRRLGLQSPVRFIGSFDRANLSWEVAEASGFGAKLRVLHGLLKDRRGATIIYGATRKSVDAVRRALAARGLPAQAYHAALPAPLRTRIQERFLGDPSPIIVATNAFGMGIDRPDVRLVGHFQLPASLEAYYQEAGRAGRDGEPARCVALFGEDDQRVHDRFLSQSYPPEHRLRSVHSYLHARYSLGREVPIFLTDLKKPLGRKMGPDGALAVLEALARSGCLVLEAGEAALEVGTVSVTLLPASPQWNVLKYRKSIEVDQLEAVCRYAQMPGCRRTALLTHFGEAPDTSGARQVGPG